MKHTFELKKICPKSLSFDIEDGLVKNISFEGGCPGNLIGISLLAEGQDALKVAELLKGIPCGDKKFSCPGELSKALIKAIGKKAPSPKGKAKEEKAKEAKEKAPAPKSKAKKTPPKEALGREKPQSSLEEPREN
jgi:uncharacterized protein (TIGR03905 family)